MSKSLPAWSAARCARDSRAPFRGPSWRAIRERPATPCLFRPRTRPCRFPERRSRGAPRFPGYRQAPWLVRRLPRSLRCCRVCRKRPRRAYPHRSPAPDTALQPLRHPDAPPPAKCPPCSAHRPRELREALALSGWEKGTSMSECRASAAHGAESQRAPLSTENIESFFAQENGQGRQNALLPGMGPSKNSISNRRKSPTGRCAPILSLTRRISGTPVRSPLAAFARLYCFHVEARSTLHSARGLYRRGPGATEHSSESSAQGFRARCSLSQSLLCGPIRAELCAIPSFSLLS